MPLQSFVVRQLKQVGPPDYAALSDSYRDPMGAVSSSSGPVYEIEATELRLSFDEVAARLSARTLHTTDLVVIDGSWMTLAESPPFSDLAQPHARRERRIRTVKGALRLLAVAAIYAAYFALRWNGPHHV